MSTVPCGLPLITYRGGDILPAILVKPFCYGKLASNRNQKSNQSIDTFCYLLLTSYYLRNPTYYLLAAYNAEVLLVGLRRKVRVLGRWDLARQRS